jgi:glycosyltransferase involved in cell wall biosynthesis
MVTIPNGIDLVETTGLAGPADGAAIRQRSGIAADDTVLLSVGRLEFNKGFDVLAAALGRAAAPGGALSGKAWRWVLAGAGPYRAEIEAAVGSRAIGPHVLFAGRLEDAALHAWYEAATIFVHPTRYEGSSLVTLEAMAHRLPVIATVAGGLPDKVRPGLNGWLVPPGSADDLARAIGDALSHRDRLRDMGQASWDIVSREFAWPILAARQVDVYEALLRRRAET